MEKEQSICFPQVSSGLSVYESCYNTEPHDKKEPIRKIFAGNCARFQTHPVVVDKVPHDFIHII
jgi:hypothetical protein